MALRSPIRVTPGFNVLGQSAQRYAGLFFMRSTDLNFAAVPIVLGLGSSSTDPLLAAGFNSFMLIAAATVANVDVKLNHLDPVTFAVLGTRTLATLSAGLGLTVVNGGAGTGVSGGGADVFHTISFTFTGALVGATLSAWHGVWGGVR